MCHSFNYRFIVMLLLVSVVGNSVARAVAQSLVAQEGEEVFASSLQRALRRGLAPSGDLYEEISSLGDYKVRSKKDAKAIVNALSTLPTSGNASGFQSPLHTLVGLFQDVDGRDAPAFPILRDEGIDELVRIFDELKDSTDDGVRDDLLFLLKIATMYGTHDGAERVVEAARIPIKPDGYMWSVIMSVLADGHPERDFVFRSLSSPLPEGFIAVSLLDAANGAAIHDRLDAHPFDSEEGRSRLKAWLTSRNEDEFSYAHSATASLPFLGQAARNDLLGLAREHTDAGVRLEAAWASAKLGQEIGFQMLRDSCLDLNQSATAIRYLAELEREDVVPKEASEPEFQAKAEFAQWLAHPNELGRPPDSLEVLDHREINWPPARETKKLWLIKYRLADRWGLEPDDVDCGLVGSATWCFFSRNMHQRSPEDCYAIHCSWELNLQASAIDDATEYEGMLSQWPHGTLTDARVCQVIEIPPELKYGRGLVTVATATLNGEKGWAVLDGRDSLWYSASAMPEDEYAGTVLSLHVGRKLLGFPPANMRQRVLDHTSAPLEPGAIVATYEKLLQQCLTGTGSEKKTLLADWRSPMISNSVRYADAVQQVGRESRSKAIVRVFMTLLDAIRSLPEDQQGDAFDRLSGTEQFEAFVDAKVDEGQSEDFSELVRLLEPHWNHNVGYATLGSMAYKGNDYPTAERLILKLRDSDEIWYRSSEMSLLAKIWHEQGKSQEASQLLIECLQRLVKELKESKDSDDRAMFEQMIQHHRTAFMELFPDDADSLTRAGLSDATMDRK